MDEYRLYFVGQDGNRLSAFDFTSADDSRAEAAARQFGCERGSELWCGARRVSGWRGLEIAPREHPKPKTQAPNTSKENTRWRDWLS